MGYWLAFPFALFLMSPLWGGGWGVSSDNLLKDQAAWDGSVPGNDGQVRTSEGMIGPPRN